MTILECPICGIAMQTVRSKIKSITPLQMRFCAKCKNGYIYDHFNKLLDIYKDVEV